MNADTLATRQHAADLFAAAARRADLSPANRLSCLQAEAALETAGRFDAAGAGCASADTLITQALRTLGTLPFEQFRTRAVKDAARHGRAALRGLRP